MCNFCTACETTSYLIIVIQKKMVAMFLFVFLSWQKILVREKENLYFGGVISKEGGTYLYENGSPSKKKHTFIIFSYLQVNV